MTLDYLHCRKHFDEIDQAYPEKGLLQELKQKNINLDQRGYVEGINETRCCHCEKLGIIIVKFRPIDDDELVPESASVKDLGEST